MAKITLIRPPSVLAKYAVTLNATPPIALAYLASSLIEAGHTIQVIDAVGEALEQVYDSHLHPLLHNGLRLEQILERIQKDTQYIGISCMFTHEWPSIQRMAKHLKAAFPQAKIIIGGEHPTAVPEYCLQSAPEVDIAVLGEGEETLVELISFMESGKDLSSVAGLTYRQGSTIVITPRRARIRQIDRIPLPRWDVIPVEAYLSSGKSFGVDIGRTMPMLATRGCPFECTFCSNPIMWTQRYETRDPALVVQEIESYMRDFNVQNIDFYDLTVIIHRQWIIDFCKLLIEKNLNLTWQLPSGTRSEAIDEEVTRYLYQSGCRNLSYAPESGSPRVLKRIKKMVIPKRMLQSMKASIRNKLSVKANIIFGFPDETFQDILRTIWFIWQMAWVGVNDVSIWAYSPYPGCELFDLLKERKKIRDFDDTYYVSLLAYSDFTSLVSYDDYLSPRAIKYLRLFGMASFYLVSYLSSPLRFFRTVRNLWTKRYQSRMEMSLASTLKRLFLYKRGGVAAPTQHLGKRAA